MGETIAQAKSLKADDSSPATQLDEVSSNGRQSAYSKESVPLVAAHLRVGGETKVFVGLASASANAAPSNLTQDVKGPLESMKESGDKLHQALRDFVQVATASEDSLERPLSTFKGFQDALHECKNLNDHTTKLLGNLEKIPNGKDSFLYTVGSSIAAANDLLLKKLQDFQTNRPSFVDVRGLPGDSQYLITKLELMEMSAESGKLEPDRKKARSAADQNKT